MCEFNITWNIDKEDRLYYGKNRSCFCIKHLNAEWTLKCVFEQKKARIPVYIEFRRISIAGESLISGVLELRDEGKDQCLTKKKFIHLIEDFCSFARIELQCPFGSVESLKTVLLTGKLSIVEQTEAALDLTQLVHVTETENSPLKKLSEDMESLLLTESLLADVRLKCGSVSFPAHKAILSARSPVFEAMFKSQTKEAASDEVVMESIDAPVLQAMLRFLYTGKTEHFTAGLVLDLLHAAFNCKIQSLESACNRYVISQMNIKNVFSNLLIGNLVSPTIKNFAMDFICNNCTDFSVLQTAESWITLKETEPALALEVLSRFVKSQEQKLKMRL